MKTVAVAVKKFTSRISEQDFRREVSHLDVLRQSLRKPACVLTHLAAIIHGQDFLILLPLVTNYTLEVFLRGGKEPLDATTDFVERYDFAERFPLLRTDAQLHRAIVKQTWGLAHALSWLHNGLTEFEEPDRYLAHMDLKPDNILIEGDPSNETAPAGTWMMSDFGISAFHRDSNRPTQNGRTILDVTTRLTSRNPSEEVQRGSGPYQPPEVTLESEKRGRHRGRRLQQRLDHRKCDVWSFGGVLSDILAFVVDGAKGVKYFRETRYQQGDDNFHWTEADARNIESSITAANTELKGTVIEWRRNISNRYSRSWIPGVMRVLFESCLITFAPDRGDITIIEASLHNLHNIVNAATYQGLETPAQNSAYNHHLNSHGLEPANGRMTEPTSTAGNLPQRYLDAQIEDSHLYNFSGFNVPANVQVVHPSPPSSSQDQQRVLERDESFDDLGPRSGQSRSSGGGTGQQNNSTDETNGHIPETINAPTNCVGSLPSLSYNLEFTVINTMTLPMPKNRVEAASFDSSGEHVAVLNDKIIFVFTTYDSDTPRSIQCPSALSGKNTSISISFPFLAIWGEKRSGEVMVSYELFHLQFTLTVFIGGADTLNKRLCCALLLF